MIWQILRDKQSIVITESYGKLYYNWDTRSLENVYQMCYKVCNMMNNKSKVYNKRRSIICEN